MEAHIVDNKLVTSADPKNFCFNLSEDAYNKIKTMKFILS